MVAENTTIIDDNPLHMQIAPEEKLQRLIVEKPDISLYEGEVCYYRKRAFAKNFYEGTLYITNIRFILLAEKYGLETKLLVDFDE